MSRVPVFRVVSESPLPPGPAFLGRDSLWIVSPDLQLLTRIHSGGTSTRSISALALDASRDRVRNVGFLLPPTRIFLFVTRGSSPVLYFLRADSRALKIRSLALDFFSFHNCVLAVCSPYGGSFCVVSRQGLTVHDLDLDPIHEVRAPVSDCCFYGSAVVAGTREAFTVYQFASDGTRHDLIRFPAESLGFPRMIFYNEQVMTIVCSSPGEPVCVHVFSYVPNRQNAAIMPQKHFFDEFLGGGVEYDRLRMSFYDDGMVVAADEGSFFVDLHLNAMTIVIGTVPVQRAAVFLDGLACDDARLYRIEPDYEALQDATAEVIGALMRRSRGLHAAMGLLARALAQVASVEAMDRIAEGVGPFVISPVAQIRYARAIEFSGIPNIHLLVRALVDFYRIRREQITDEALVPLLHVLTHHDCRLFFGELFASSGAKLNKAAIRAIAGKFDEVFELNPQFAENLLDFAEVCIEFGRDRQARNLIMREVLLQTKPLSPADRTRISAVARKYMDVFGDTKAGTMEQIIEGCERA
jgi:hypothetical protein